MNLKNTTFLIALALLFSCGGGGQSQVDQIKSQSVKEKPTFEEAVKDWRNNYGIGPITSVELGEIDQAMVDEGFDVFDLKCTACHSPYKEKVGPAMVGILDRRRPEWIMNMILNPMEMAKTDPICVGLLAQYNTVMADQRLSEDQVRKILEYFRTLKLDNPS
ncbi:MAG: cytochrome c [Cyclobacteriaceae bacterium]|nr:cytochrome c [Cyclobacteriaceae bacterium]